MAFEQCGNIPGPARFRKISVRLGVIDLVRAPLGIRSEAAEPRRRETIPTVVGVILHGNLLLSVRLHLGLEPRATAVDDGIDLGEGQVDHGVRADEEVVVGLERLLVGKEGGVPAQEGPRGRGAGR